MEVKPAGTVTAMTETTVTPARQDQRSVIANLIQLYLYDMTESMPFPVGADGRFEYGFLERFWRFPYLIYVGDELAGFALVIDECPLTGRNPCWFMAEFFILKAYRRTGVGQAALNAALALHAGDWHIAVPLQNERALAFWGNVLLRWTPVMQDVNFDGDQWVLRTFAV